MTRRASRPSRTQAHPAQIGFAFDVPPPASEAADLAGLEQRISRAVARALKDDERARETIAAEMSVLLDEEVSAHMLNAYASPAREEHKVPMSRFWALIAVTDRFELLNTLLREIGAALLVGEEIHTARLGHIDRQIARLQAERKRIAGVAPIIGEGRNS